MVYLYCFIVGHLGACTHMCVSWGVFHGGVFMFVCIRVVTYSMCVCRCACVCVCVWISA